MKHIIAATTALALLAVPVVAQDTEDSEGGLSLMERGAQMFMDGINREMAPAFDNLSELADQMRPALRNFAREMGPRLGDLLDKVDDWNAYEAPEILDNGDIIMRRKPDHPVPPGGLKLDPADDVEL